MVMVDIPVLMRGYKDPPSSLLAQDKKLAIGQDIQAWMVLLCTVVPPIYLPTLPTYLGTCIPRYLGIYTIIRLGLRVVIADAAGRGAGADESWHGKKGGGWRHVYRQAIYPTPYMAI